VASIAYVNGTAGSADLSLSNEASLASTVYNYIKSTPSLAIASSTSIEQVAYGYYGMSGSSGAQVTGSFAGSIPLESGNLAALGSGEYNSYAPAISGSATAAAGAAQSGNIATDVADVIPASGDPAVAAAISAVGGLTDAQRYTVATDIITVNPAQDANVAGAVAPYTTGTTSGYNDKVYLAYYITTAIVSLNRTGDVPAIAQSIGATYSATDPNLGSDLSLVGYAADLPVTSSSLNQIVPATDKALVSDTVGGSNISLAAQAAVTGGLIGDFASQASLTATTGEATSITILGSGTGTLVNIATDYAVDSPKYSGTFANYAANGQAPTEAGVIGATVVANATLPSTVTAGSIATGVAQVATSGPDFNDTLYTVAQQFGLQSGTGAGKISYGSYYSYPAGSGIATALASLATGGTNTAAVAAIATAITEHLNNAAAIIDVAEYIAYENPADAPDILGSVFDTVTGVTSPNTVSLASLEAVINPGTLETDIENATKASPIYGTLDLTGTAGTAFFNQQFNNAYTMSVTDQPSGPTVDQYYYGLTPDETPIYDL
jgi:hypothetical protein